MTETHLEDLTTRIKPRTASNLLLWFVVGFVVIFFLWAAFTKLDRTVRAQGRVIPSSQLQIVSNLEGGIVQDILVRSGQHVDRGTELIRLNPIQAGAELGSGEASLLALDMKIARLTAEIQGREPAYPPAATPLAADTLRIEQSLHASRVADLGSILGAARARLLQAERGVNEADANAAARRQAAEARRSEVRTLRPLVERGIEPRFSLTQAENAAAVAASEAEAAAATAGRARAAVVEARTSLAQLGQEWRAQAATELATAQGERAARFRALPALANRMERTVLRAPLAGRINRVLVTTRGGSVRAGEPVVEIVPSDESLLIEARVTPADIAFISLGQHARVSLTAYDRAIYGVLEGSVINISPDAVIEERTGESFYTVRVRTDQNFLLDPRGRRLAIGPGMIAEVDLLGDQRTILQYILSPITKLGESALRDR
ncbi:MAG TPA: HlyD family type I secretion periplasmic adaptor subunit [Allosphingosinicella sp.]|nr:HlyD family type I secretion periplasmic adaptor subunit [Allosphingosinicella sp.]